MRALLFFCLLPLLASCRAKPSGPGIDGLPCFPRLGNCVKIHFGEVPVERLDKGEINPLVLSMIPSSADVGWMLAGTADPKVNIRVQPTPGSEVFFGDTYRPIVKITPLSGQQIETRRKGVISDDVRADGKPLAGMANVMKGNAYVPGIYIFSIRIQGTKNWDEANVVVIIE